MTADNLAQARRIHILNAAAGEINERSFAGFRMDDIARASGFSKGTIYTYFESKEALIVALLDHIMLPFNAVAAAFEVDSASDAGTRLLTLGDALLQAFEEIMPMFAMALDYFAMSIRQNVISTMMKTYLAQFQQVLETMLQEGVDAGEIKTDSVIDTAAAIIASIEGVALMAALDPERIDLKRTGRHAMELLVESLRRH